MNINFKISILLLGLITLIGVFYWFEYRVYLIEKDCSDNLLASAVSKQNRDLYDKNYKICINSGGYENFSNIVGSNKPFEVEEKTPEKQEVQIKVQ